MRSLGGPARAEIGWWVAAPHRRQGIATRAVQLLAGWARGVLEFELFAEVDPDNPPSIWVAESAGLRLRLGAEAPTPPNSRRGARQSRRGSEVAAATVPL